MDVFDLCAYVFKRSDVFYKCLVEGKWEEVAANLLETNQRRVRRVPKKMVAGGV